MAEVKISFSVAGSDECMEYMDSIMYAFEENGWSMEIESEEDGLNVEVESADIETILGWACMINRAFKNTDMSDKSFSFKGVADNDYDSYTAFVIEASQGVVCQKQYDFEIECDEDEMDDPDDFAEEYEAAEEEAFEALESIASIAVTESELEYDEEEFGLVKDGIEAMQ